MANGPQLTGIPFLAKSCLYTCRPDPSVLPTGRFLPLVLKKHFRPSETNRTPLSSSTSVVTYGYSDFTWCPSTTGRPPPQKTQLQRYNNAAGKEERRDRQGKGPNLLIYIPYVQPRSYCTCTSQCLLSTCSFPDSQLLTTSIRHSKKTTTPKSTNTSTNITHLSYFCWSSFSPNKLDFSYSQESYFPAFIIIITMNPAQSFKN